MATCFCSLSIVPTKGKKSIFFSIQYMILANAGFSSKLQSCNVRAVNHGTEARYILRVLQNETLEKQSENVTESRAHSQRERVKQHNSEYQIVSTLKTSIYPESFSVSSMRRRSLDCRSAVIARLLVRYPHWAYCCYVLGKDTELCHP